MSQDKRFEEFLERFLEWRGIEKACTECTGSGYKVYGNTSTWHYGIGGQMMTTDVCDKCWGSGNADKPWPSWRKR